MHENRIYKATVQCHGRPRPVGAPHGGAPLAHDGQYQSDPRWRVAPHCGGVSMDTPKTCVPHALPLPIRVLDDRLARRPTGALIIGLRHGMYCTGCCGFLMALFFVVGVMNPLWVATMTLLVLVEKVVPRGEVVGSMAGGVLVIAGLVLLGQGLR